MESIPRFPREGWLLCAIPIVLLGCSPTVRVTTPEPVRINVHMGVEVTEKQSVHAAPVSPEIAERRRLRSGEIQGLKNAGVIGEDRDGFLAVVNPPTDPSYKQFAEHVVQDENRDRLQLYMAQTKLQGKTFEEIQDEYARRWARRAFPGEYVQQPDGTWVRK
ncbi:hypothetical protein MAMC_00354 [Methylacidimicrobium cyclopophantes]|uniref:DUF1318 domain-containing protein n=1 Tax=Methylacidimicrobium cyclopophantes TaxID=1041766 RepID=A0A5E6M9D8_9BACT|nr:YdbL family protein [Methylacidimicrobium cyclopophantes]VVM04983.1 hypothetical protein MAMC_00354 [Methylacidimicrobium cyclopophantes]